MANKRIEKAIERQLFEVNCADNDLWRVLFNNLLITYKWTDYEKLIRKRYIEHKSVVSVCMEISISEKTYARWRHEILNKAFDWAKEYKLM